jgi:NADH dehydrogenase
MRVTLVDRHPYSTFQPLLYQVATGGLNPGDVAYPIWGFAGRRGVRFRHGRVEGIDVDGRRVLLADGGAIAYDYLIVAVGTTVNYFDVAGAAEHALALYTRTEAITLRDALMGALERAAGDEGTPGAGVTDGAMSVVVVGGGATGVEIAGTLAELSAALPAAFPMADPSMVRVVLVEQAGELLGPFAPSLRAYARRQLERRGVEVMVGTGITQVGPDLVHLVDGSTLRADLTVWAAGVGVDAAVSSWGLPVGRGGRILVGPDLVVAGHQRIFAVGDAALDPDHPLAQLAQPAIQTGRHAAGQVLRLVSGQPTVPFRYHDKGTMATIGRRAAVLQLPVGLRVTGTLAWLGWLGLHIFSLLGNRNRASALLNLTARYLSWPSGLIVGDTPEPARE